MKPPTSPPADRDSSGRFQPGCSPGPGRPPKATEARYGELLKEVVDEGAFQELLRALLAQTFDGSAAAAKLLLDRLLPIPKPGTEPDPDPRDLPDDHEGDAALGALSDADLRKLAESGALRLDPGSTPTEVLVAMARVDVKGSNGSRPVPSEQAGDDDGDLEAAFREGLGG